VSPECIGGGEQTTQFCTGSGRTKGLKHSVCWSQCFQTYPGRTLESVGFGKSDPIWHQAHKVGTQLPEAKHSISYRLGAVSTVILREWDSLLTREGRFSNQCSLPYLISSLVNFSPGPQKTLSCSTTTSYGCLPHRHCGRVSPGSLTCN
jgi:hypothetical protein